MAEESKEDVKAQETPVVDAALKPVEATEAEAKPAAEEKAPEAEKKAEAKKPKDTLAIIDEATGAASADDGDKPAIRRRVKGAKSVPVGIVHILASFNNTTVSVTDPRGNVLSWSNGGRCGFKGSRKSTAYAGTIVCQEACKAALGHGLHEVEVRVQGPGSGRESAIRAVQAAGLTISGITDITPVPHNGCRAPKRRRV